MALTTEDLDSALAQHLVSTGHLSGTVAAELVAAAHRTGSSLTERLAAGGDVAPAALTAALAELTGLRHVPPEQLRANRAALDLVGTDLAADVDCLPLAVNDSRVVVAFALPPAASALERLAAQTGRTVVPVLSEPDALREVRRAASDPANSGVPVHIDQLLSRVLEVGGSDLHLTAGAPPKVRVHGSLRAIDGFDVLDS